ncbi:MAG: polymorphic toxin-type HINT domain-containing protein [Micropruina sp.]
MSDGSSKPISEVELGERVWATDPKTGEEGPRAVTDLIRHSGSHVMVQVSLADGTTIDATDGHPFWVVDVQSQSRWTDAVDLTAGDTLIGDNGTAVTVAGVAIHTHGV